MRLLIFPIVLGDGEHLFEQTSDKKPMRLVHARTVGGGVAHVTCEMVRAA